MMLPLNTPDKTYAAHEGSKVGENPPAEPQGRGSFNFTITLEGAAVLLTAMIALAVKFLKPWAYRTWASFTRRDMIDSILVRDTLVAAMTVSKAKSIHLTRFHNGFLDSKGYHMLRVSLVEAVSIPPFTTEWKTIGKKAVVLKDIPEDMRLFLKESMKDAWVEFDYDSQMFEDNCKRFVGRLGHKFQMRRVIYAGNVASGAVSINFATREDGLNVVKDVETMAILDAHFLNLSEIVVGKLSLKEKENLATSVFRYIYSGGSD